MFPGVILQMCYWYRPDEMSIRLLYFCEFPGDPWSPHLMRIVQTSLETFPAWSAGYWHLPLTAFRVRQGCQDGNGK